MFDWIVIGVGDITTKRVLPAILSEPRSRLTGIVTRDPQKAEPFGVPGWTDLEAALNACACDAVYVASPVFLHAPQTMAALRAGKHVLCEKPMAMDHAEAQSMVAAARQANRTLGIAYYRRMYPGVNRAKELIASGAIGQVVSAEATAHDWFHPTDGFRQWLIDPRMSGGGPLYDIASHRIDLMNYLFGKPQTAIGQRSTVVHPSPVEDNATVLIEYASGVRAMVDVRWHSHTVRDEFRIRGTEGEIEMSPLNSGILVYPGGREDLPPHCNLHYPCVEEFVTACLEKTPFRCSAEQAALTSWITDEVVTSSSLRSAVSSDRA